MTSRVIETEVERKNLYLWLGTRELPFTVNVVKGKKRSVEQNRLQRLWLGEIAEQWENHTKEEIRGWCKLHLGVPILREENEEFRAAYDRVIKPLPYEDKLLAMQEPLDFGVTRIMTTKQETRYLDSIIQHFAGKGIVLTMPEERR